MIIPFLMAKLNWLIISKPAVILRCVCWWNNFLVTVGLINKGIRVSILNSCTQAKMILHIHPENPQPRQIKTLVECLREGGVIIYPTDTVYGLGCDIFHQKAVEKICRIKGVDPLKAQLSFVCDDLSDLSKYTKSITTPLYRLLKSHIPGPFTFILPASKEVPKILKSKKTPSGFECRIILLHKQSFMNLEILF